jgi:predicted  nucleic acid-binding Zn-ribbon protein
MSELKTVYNKLFKTELASQKIELASVKELQKTISDIKSGIGAIEKIGTQLASELSKAQSTKNAMGDSVKSVSSLGSFAENQIKDFLNKAKDLGVDVSNIVELKQIETLQKDIKDYKAYFNGLGKIPNL